MRLRFFELSRVLVRFDYITRFIVNTNYGIMCAAAVHRVANCIVRRVIPQPTEWQRIGN